MGSSAFALRKQLAEIADHRVRAEGSFGNAWAQRVCSSHARSKGCIELWDRIGNKENLPRNKLQRGADLPIAVGFTLWARSRIEIRIEELRQVSGSGVLEEKLLGQHAAGGEARLGDSRPARFFPGAF